MLLGHVGAVRAQPGLDVDERHAAVDGGAGAGERGVGVAADDDGVGALGFDQVFNADAGEIDLLAVTARADAEVVVRLGQARGEDLAAGHRVVVVLAGVHEDLLRAVGERLADGRGLDDLRGGRR